MRNLTNANSELQTALQSKIGEEIIDCSLEFEELTLTLQTETMMSVLRVLKDDVNFQFDTLIDLCGVDYSLLEDYKSLGKRFGVVYHFLSTTKNQRIRLKLFCDSAETPQIKSVTCLWPSAHWYEREAFDLFGIFFPANFKHGLTGIFSIVA